MALTPYWYRWLWLIPYFTYAWLLLDLVWKEAPYDRRLILSLCLGISLLVVFTTLFGAKTHDLPRALQWGAVLASFGSALLAWAGARFKSSEPWKILWSWALLPIGFVFLFTSWMAIRVAVKFAFHDQLMIQAHLPLIESILRGNLPPALQVFPDIPLKYHFGADVFGAVMSYVTGLPAYRAIDITQGLGWCLTLLALYYFCREAGLSRGFSEIAMTWVMMGAGWAYLLKPWLLEGAYDSQNFIWPHSYIIFFRHLNPGTVSNFFMTPYSLGFPLFFSYLTLFARWTRRNSFGILAVCALLLTALAIIQVTFFASLLTVTMATLALQKFWEKSGWKQLALQYGVLLLSVPLALLMGGFFSRSGQYSSQSILVHWPPGYLKNATWWGGHPIDASQSFLWYLATFGSLVFLSLPCFAAGVYFFKRRPESMLLFLLLYAAQSFVIPQFLSYRLTWDIIKWFTGFHVTMMLIVIFVWARLPPKLWIYALFCLLILPDLVAPTRFLYDLAFVSPIQMPADHRKWWTKTPALTQPGASFERVLSLLRQYPWNEVVFAPYQLANLIAWYSGQAVSEIDANTKYFGVRPEVMQARHELTSTLVQDFDWRIMAQSPIRWMVFYCDDFDKTFTAISKEHIQTAVSEGALSDYSFENNGCWKVYHLSRKR